MLDRERSPSTSAVAQDRLAAKDESLQDDLVDEQVETRVHRTTIVPMPLDDLDSDPTCLTSPLRVDDASQLELDEPDLFEPEVDDPTGIGDTKGTQSGRPESAVAVSVSLTNTVERLVAPPQTPTKSARPPTLPRAKSASQRPPSQPQARSESQRPEHVEYSRSDKWYLRVQLDTDCLTDLWIRDRTPHNVLVWSEDMESWVPLLTVRELRDAIREAHDAKTREELHESNFVFVNTQVNSADQHPLPEPRLPGSPPVPRPARTVSQWSQPKARTISNVPPPLLTTAVPVFASQLAQPQLAQPQFAQPQLAQPQLAQPQLLKPPRAPMSTVPPVVTSIQPVQESQSGVAAVPDFPRPARVPNLESIARDAAARSAPALVRPVLVSPSSAKPTPHTRVGKAKALLAGLPLIHVERALWLAAGVAISSATMLLMRDAERDPNSSGRASAVRLGTLDADAQSTSTPAKGTASSSARSDEVHRIEDLPIVSGSASGGWKAPRSSRERTKATSQTVAPADVKLGTAVNTLGPTSATPSAGGFDTGAARRVLTGSANRVSRCATEGPASGSVLVTFAPSGFVQSASISGLTGQGVNVSCVLRAFQEARVSPFSGSPVTVRKGFQIL